MEKGKISIIIPVYNTEKNLENCLNSVINQTYSNLEIILVDDGSTDGSSDICNIYAEKDSRITVIHKKNEGVSAARNLGLDIAKGDYIGFVDSDDYLALNMYEVLLSRLLKDGSDMVCCNYLQVYEERDSSVENQKPPLKDECLNAQKAMDSFILYGGWYVVPFNKLYKKSIYQTLRFPVGKRWEDLYIIHKIICQCNKISHVSETLYYYVRNKDSFTMKGFRVENFERGGCLD